MLNRLLLYLLEQLDYERGVTRFSWDQLESFGADAVGKFVELGLLKPSVKAKAVECLGCEYACFSQVEYSALGKARKAYIVCEEPTMQAQMGRVPVDERRLKRWTISRLQLAKCVQETLQLDGDLDDGLVIRLGMLTRKSRRFRVSLAGIPASIEINSHRTELAELLYFDESQLRIDTFRIDEMLDNRRTASKAYEPSVDKREARKAATQAMYKDWRDAYLLLKRKNPDKSNTWVSRQIAKMEIAQGRDAGTIYKNMC